MPVDAGVPGPGGRHVEADHEQGQPRGQDDGQPVREARVSEAAIAEVQNQVETLEEVGDSIT